MRDVTLHVSVQIEDPVWETRVTRIKNKIRLAIETALLSQSKVRLRHPSYELNIVLTNDSEMRALNAKHREKDYATNVLSFPMETTPATPAFPVMLGDIVLTHGVITAEAKAQKKTFQNHFLHLLVHGTLHLCGYDHMTHGQARTMQRLERAVLSDLDIPDPYALP